MATKVMMILRRKKEPPRYIQKSWRLIPSLGLHMYSLSPDNTARCGANLEDRVGPLPRPSAYF